MQHKLHKYPNIFILIVYVDMLCLLFKGMQVLRKTLVPSFYPIFGEVL